MLLMWSP